MKNKIPIILAVLLIIIVFCIVIIVSIKKECPENKYIEVGISKISISEVSESLQYYFYNEKNFFAKDISDYVINDIINNPHNYKEICIDYKYRNLSDSIVMKDVRFHPDFSDIMKKSLISYNSGNGTYYIFTEPGHFGSMRQHIVLNCSEFGAKNMYDELINQKISMVYFTGSFMTNAGRGYFGVGKHEYIFTIKDKLE